MTQPVDLYKYQDFVQSITSAESDDLKAFIKRLNKLDANVGGPAFNVSLLLNSGIGLGSEGGEFEEIVKKVYFQGKKVDDDLVFHLKRELGDIIWYWINACRALHLDPNEVIAENVTKLESRYPGGKFDVFSSENRKVGDL